MAKQSQRPGRSARSRRGAKWSELGIRCRQPGRVLRWRTRLLAREGWVSNAADLFVALRAGDTAAVARILEEQPALAQARNEQGISAVLMACYMGRKEIRDLLIEKGAHLELHEAAAAGNLPRVRELVEANLQLAKSYSPDGFPVLALAAAFGH